MRGGILLGGVRGGDPTDDYPPHKTSPTKSNYKGGFLLGGGDYYTILYYAMLCYTILDYTYTILDYTAAAWRRPPPAGRGPRRPPGSLSLSLLLSLLDIIVILLLILLLLIITMIIIVIIIHINICSFIAARVAFFCGLQEEVGDFRVPLLAREEQRRPSYEEFMLLGWLRLGWLKIA